jgi:hypothetical protein
MTPETQRYLDALPAGVTAQAVLAAVAIDQQFGRAAMLTYARASDDMAVKMFAARLVDTLTTIRLLTEWVAIDEVPEGDKVASRRVKARMGRLMRRIDKLLADGLARVFQPTCPTGERDSADPISHGAHEAEPLT